tara:strand:+ start:417 stop:755 length:339 start_codon:yes stop_codon:yes gene_type:complete
VEYLAQQKPNFCPSCGSSFSGAVAEENEENGDPEEEISSLAVDSDFELEFDIMERPKTSNKLSDLAGTSSGSPEMPRSKKGRGRPKKVNKEQVWKDFKQEAGGTPRKRKSED